jgi:transcriptional regulator with XRE-family HTH domain
MMTRQHETPGFAAGKAFVVEDKKVIKAGKQPGILARRVGSMLQKVREVAGLSYDEAAALLGCEADWLARVETGFAVAGPEEVACILVEYGAREASVSDRIIDLARRAAAPPPWLAAHEPRLSAATRDVLLVEAECTLAQVHGFMVIPPLVQTEEYFREMMSRRIGGGTHPDADQDWELLSSRQAHQPGGVIRLLDVIIDESAIWRFGAPEIMAGQLRRLLALADSPHATVRVIPDDAPFWEQRGNNFQVLSFAGTEDRIGVFYYPITGPEFISPTEAHETWTRIETNAVADPTHSRAILERHLAAID